MALIARNWSDVRATPCGLLCAGVSVVSTGVWLLGESPDPAMVVAEDFDRDFCSVVATGS